ncbi:MAG: ECF transporter S component [Clostridia bacterium]|nr:ECF transporter S component [Clostridia bacterium]
MKSVTKSIANNAMGIALFVVLSLCLQVPVFENYYLCLGYIAMTVYCYVKGTISGTIVGTIGVVLYCLLINGLRGMPGWAVANLLLGIIMGITFKAVKRLKKPLLETIISSIVIMIATAIAMLIVKSSVESFLYSQPFILRCTKNVYAFVADAFVIIISIPICRFLEPKLKEIINK